MRRNSNIRERDRQADVALPGVIDTLGVGYATLAARPLLVLPLMVLDLAIAFIPRISVTPLTSAIGNMLKRQGSGWDDFGREVERLNGGNLLGLLSLQMPMARTPSLVPSLSPHDAPALGWSGSVTSLPAAIVVVGIVLLLIAGFGYAAGFRSLLAQAVNQGALIDRALVHFALQGSLRLIGWSAAVIGLLALVSMPLVVLTVFGSAVGMPEAAYIWILLLLPLAWGFVHFYFSVHAVFVDHSGPFDALRSSFRVVRRYFWPSLQFILISLMISTGLTFALQRLAESGAGIFLAIAINAFVATGLSVAAMSFYRDRARHLGLPFNVPGR